MSGSNGHKAEAEKALKQVIAALTSPETIDGLRRHTIKATAEFALEEVGLIQEVKRARKAAAPEASDGSPAT